MIIREEPLPALVKYVDGSGLVDGSDDTARHLDDRPSGLNDVVSMAVMTTPWSVGAETVPVLGPTVRILASLLLIE